MANCSSYSLADQSTFFMPLSKEKVYSACLQILEKKISDLRAAYNSVIEATGNETKSTAGDKHETSRAMMQIEQEKIGRQLAEAMDQKKELEAIDITQSHQIIGKGSVIKTDKAILFLGPGLGKITIGNDIIIAVSSHSPLGKKLTGRRKNDLVELNGHKYFIEEVI
jgi:hypothetical protein